jgi:hypothetical protein
MADLSQLTFCFLRSLDATGRTGVLSKILRAVLQTRNNFEGDKPHLAVRVDNRWLWSIPGVLGQLGALGIEDNGSMASTVGIALRLGVTLRILVKFEGKPGAFFLPVRSHPNERLRPLMPPRLTPRRRARTLIWSLQLRLPRSRLRRLQRLPAALQRCVQLRSP